SLMSQTRLGAPAAPPAELVLSSSIVKWAVSPILLSVSPVFVRSTLGWYVFVNVQSNVLPPSPGRSTVNVHPAPPPSLDQPFCEVSTIEYEPSPRVLAKFVKLASLVVTVSR